MYLLCCISVYYLVSSMIMTALSIVTICINIRLYNQPDDKPVPGWLHTLILTYLAGCFCTRKQNPVSPRSEDGGDKKDQDIVDNGVAPSTDTNTCKCLRDQVLHFTRGNDGINKHNTDSDWKDMSRVLDQFFFVLYLVSCFLLTLGFYLKMAQHL